MTKWLVKPAVVPVLVRHGLTLLVALLGAGLHLDAQVVEALHALVAVVDKL